MDGHQYEYYCAKLLRRKAFLELRLREEAAIRELILSPAEGENATEYNVNIIRIR